MSSSASVIREKLSLIGKLVLMNGKLDVKTKALIALSSAASVSCGHCKEQSKKMAQKFGADGEEIKEAEELAVKVREKCREYPVFFTN